jgi:hypothetical protein
MSRENLLKKISRAMSKGLFDCLTDVVMIPEPTVSKWIHKWKQDLEGEQIVNFSKHCTPMAQELLALYRWRGKEFFDNCKQQHISLPEYTNFKKKKAELRRLWNLRPRTGVEYYLKKEHSKEEQLKFDFVKDEEE